MGFWDSLASVDLVVIAKLLQISSSYAGYLKSTERSCT